MTHLTAILLDAGLKAAVVLLLVTLVTLCLRRASAATRHLLWTLAVIGVLVLPLLSAELPAWRVLPAIAAPHPTSSSTSTTAQKPQPRIDASGDDAGSGSLFGRSQRVTAVAPPVIPTPTPAPSRATLPSPPTSAAAPTHTASQPIDWLALFAWWTPMIWLAGLGIALLPMLLGALSLWRLRRESQPIKDPAVLDMFRRAKMGLDLSRVVELLESPCRGMPLTWGIGRAKVLLPEEARHWPRERVWAVLLHELAHVKRRDCLTQLFTQIACGLYWYNPLMWFASRRMLIERERACDDLVLGCGTRQSDYAEHLLSVAAGPRAQRFAAFAGIAMARKSGVEGRLLAILDAKRNRRTLGRVGVAAAVAVLAGIVVPVAMVQAGKPQGKDGLAHQAGVSQTGPFTARLPHGVTVQLVGLAPHPSAGKQWWKPDGTPTATPLANVGKRWIGSPHWKLYECIVRIRGLKTANPDITTTSLGDGSESSEGSQANGVYTWHDAFTFDPAAKTMHLRMGIAYGRWKTLARESSKDVLVGTAHGHISFAPAALGPGPGITLSVDHDVTNHDLRIMAINQQGQALQPRNMSTSDSDGVETTTATFPRVYVKDIKRFEFQVRPYHYVTFKNVSLRPGHRTHVTVTSAAQATGANPASARLPSQPTDTDIKKGVSLAKHLMAGEYKQVRQMFDQRMRKALPASKLAALKKKLDDIGGQFQGIGQPRTATIEHYKVVYVPLRWEHNQLDLKVVFDKNGKVGGLWTVAPTTRGDAEHAATPPGGSGHAALSADRFLKTTPDGASARIVAIGVPSKTGTRWILPDGTPLTQAPFDSELKVTPLPAPPGTFPDDANYLLLLTRAHGPSGEKHSVTQMRITPKPDVFYSVQPQGVGHFWRLFDTVYRENLGLISAYGFAHVPDRLTVELKIGGGKWQSLGKWERGGTNNTLTIERIQQHGNDTYLYLKHPPIDYRLKAVQTVVTNTQGKILQLASVFPGDPYSRVIVNNVRPNQIQKVVMDVRPWDVMTFDNLPTSPNASKPAIDPFTHPWRLFEAAATTKSGKTVNAAVPPDSSGTRGKLAFRIAPRASSLDKAELASERDWLRAGRVGFWWKSGRIAGRVPHYVWLPVRAKLPGSGQLVTGMFQSKQYLLVSDKPAERMVSGEGKNGWGLTSVQASTDAPGHPAVLIQLDPRGGERLAALSRANIGKRLAIVVAGRVVIAPTIMSMMRSNVMISGQFTAKAVAAMVQTLRAGETTSVATHSTRTTPAHLQRLPNQNQPLNSGDVVGVSVFELFQPDKMDGERQRVDEQGQIRMPILGWVKAAGLTPRALAKEIKKRLLATHLMDQTVVRAKLLVDVPANPNYHDPKLKAGDRLEVRIYELQKPGQHYDHVLQVGKDGTIQLPGLGKVHVAGQTVPELEDRLVKLLWKKRILKDAAVRCLLVVEPTDKPATQPHAGGQVSFLPAQQRTINEVDASNANQFLDLDTGKLITIPQKQAAQKHWTDHDAIAWLRQQGANLGVDFASNGFSLAAVDLTLKQAGKDALDKLRSAGLGKQLRGDNPGDYMIERSGMRGYVYDHPPKLPVTLVFQTKKGTRGILQIVGYTSKPKGIVIRYHVVENIAKEANHLSPVVRTFQKQLLPTFKRLRQALVAKEDARERGTSRTPSAGAAYQAFAAQVRKTWPYTWQARDKALSLQSNGKYTGIRKIYIRLKNKTRDQLMHGKISREQAVDRLLSFAKQWKTTYVSQQALYDASVWYDQPIDTGKANFTKARALMQRCVRRKDQLTAAWIFCAVELAGEHNDPQQRMQARSKLATWFEGYGDSDKLATRTLIPSKVETPEDFAYRISGIMTTIRASEIMNIKNMVADAMHTKDPAKSLTFLRKAHPTNAFVKQEVQKAQRDLKQAGDRTSSAPAGSARARVQRFIKLVKAHRFDKAQAMMEGAAGVRSEIDLLGAIDNLKTWHIVHMAEDHTKAVALTSPLNWGPSARDEPAIILLQRGRGPDPQSKKWLILDMNHWPRAQADAKYASLKAKLSPESVDKSNKHSRPRFAMPTTPGGFAKPKASTPAASDWPMDSLYEPWPKGGHLSRLAQTSLHNLLHDLQKLAPKYPTLAKALPRPAKGKQGSPLRISRDQRGNITGISLSLKQNAVQKKQGNVKAHPWSRSDPDEPFCYISVELEPRPRTEPAVGLQETNGPVKGRGISSVFVLRGRNLAASRTVATDVLGLQKAVHRVVDANIEQLFKEVQKPHATSSRAGSVPSNLPATAPSSGSHNDVSVDGLMNLMKKGTSSADAPAASMLRRMLARSERPKLSDARVPMLTSLSAGVIESLRANDPAAAEKLAARYAEKILAAHPSMIQPSLQTSYLQNHCWFVETVGPMVKRSVPAAKRYRVDWLVGQAYAQTYHMKFADGWLSATEAARSRRITNACTSAYEAALAEAPDAYRRLQISAQWMTLQGDEMFDSDSKALRQPMLHPKPAAPAVVTKRVTLFRLALTGTQNAAKHQQALEQSVVDRWTGAFKTLAKYPWPQDIIRKVASDLHACLTDAKVSSADLKTPETKTMVWYLWQGMLLNAPTPVERSVINQQVEGLEQRLRKATNTVVPPTSSLNLGKQYAKQLKVAYAKWKDNRFFPYFRQSRRLPQLHARYERLQKQIEHQTKEYANSSQNKQDATFFGRTVRAFITLKFAEQNYPLWFYSPPRGVVYSGGPGFGPGGLVYFNLGRIRPWHPYPDKKSLTGAEAKKASTR